MSKKQYKISCKGYTVYILCLILSGCASKYNNRSEQKAFVWQQQEARFYDIPVMIHAKPDYTYYDQKSDDSTTFIAYTAEAPFNDVQTYYTSQMERYGWRHVTSIIGYEQTLVFEKPEKLCIISLRLTKNKNETKVVISQAYL